MFDVMFDVLICIVATDTTVLTTENFLTDLDCWCLIKETTCTPLMFGKMAVQMYARAAACVNAAYAELPANQWVLCAKLPVSLLRNVTRNHGEGAKSL